MLANIVHNVSKIAVLVEEVSGRLEAECDCPK